MQANRFGFESKAHPCANGTCDAMSQCIIGMQKQGVRDYGEYAYGPHGSFIDTNAKFHVKNEFVSTTDYQTFWKLRTILSQNGSEIVMEADCRDYLKSLSDPIEGGMGLVLSSWDNTSVGEDFELDWGQSKQENCDAASNIISNFSVKQGGSTENMPDDGEDAKDGFLKYVIDIDGNTITKYLSTKEWSTAETMESSLTISGNNSLFLRDTEDHSSASIFKPTIRGGSISYDVDVSR